jgi:DNA-binding SARP family transcriptional activator
MAHLSVRLLGPFQVALGAEPVTTFESDKVRALLAYLVVEAGRPHRRERLAGLLWPEFPERSARSNLRGALTNLRRVMGDRGAVPPFLHISREALQFNTASDAWVDVGAFVDRVGAEVEPSEAISPLEEALELYRGSFLEGFSLADSPVFEEWALLKRERFQRLFTQALRQLAECYAARGEYGVALGHARRLLELDPLMEAAHRQVMRLLVYSGERGAALAQYATCRRVLAAELDVAPSYETQRLYEQIRSGALEIALPPPTRPRELPLQRPAFLEENVTVQVERPVFVARERELAWLEQHLEQALAGQGRVAFVVGGPGRGKTMLMQAFARRAMEVYAELLVACGNGNAYSGVGDPYLPFRDTLDMLAGDVEARWAAGAIDRDHAVRLWHALPLMARALVEVGPDLIDTFLPGRALLTRAAAYQDPDAPDGVWMKQLEELVARKGSLPPDPNLQQSALFKQYTRVLAALARQRPLLLLLDDLQWLDAGSIGLLFHLGRELPGRRILILGAYRPEEVALGRPAALRGGCVAGRQERHPLEGVLAEFQRRFGDVWLDLSRTEEAEGRQFVDALVDSELNRLGEAFRSRLYRRTEGHPLFTAELLRAMQERGDLIQDEERCWVQGPTLDWKTLPPKVEGVIAERVNRLEGALREILAVASVEGEQFTAQVIARVQEADEREVIHQLSGTLEQQHRLVRAQGVQDVSGLRLSLHRFQHNLFQKHLYDGLNPAERAYLHADVGNALEALYADHPEELAAVAPQLARHFQEAGITRKAVEYLRQAGEWATRMSANQEAVAHFSQALELLETLSESLQRAKTELTLQADLAVPLLSSKGWSAPEVGRTLDRAWELCEKLEEPTLLFPILFLMQTRTGSLGDFQTALEIAERMLAIAERNEAAEPRIVAHTALAWALLAGGEFALVLVHVERVGDLYDPIRHHTIAYQFGNDPRVLCLGYGGLALWILGYPDQARSQIHKGLTLAQQLSYPFSLASAQVLAGITYVHCGDWQRAEELAQACVNLSDKHGFSLPLAYGMSVHGRALVERRRPEDGVTQLRQAVAAFQSAHYLDGQPVVLPWLAQAYAKAGKVEEGLTVVAEALALTEKAGDQRFEAEIHRLSGELLWMQSADAAEVESRFWKAIAVARRQCAKSWELRATISLARLWQRQGKREDARKVLAEIYRWFSEGFDTADLQEARALLDELSDA